MNLPGPTFTCYCDGASRGNPGRAAAGVVVLDESGRERRALSLYLGEMTNNAAEYLALQEGLRGAADVCREDSRDPAAVSVVLKTDSQLVARQVAGEYKVKSPDLLPLARSFRDLARGFFRVRVDCVPREGNRRADQLANEALDRAAGGRPSRYSRLSHLECSRCGGHYDPSEPHGTCPACAGPLLARYALSGLAWPPVPAAGLTPDTMWRYHELLPVGSPGSVVSLGEGRTPLVPLTHRAAAAAGREGAPGGYPASLARDARIWLKDEGLSPTGTFKARGASAAVSRLVELGQGRCALATAGNAGSAFAAYAARAGIELLAAMPEDTPEAIQRECAGYGATVVTVPGLLPDAGRYVRERAAAEGWFVASTFDEPYRLEGKKTIAFEVFEALGGRWPDAIVCPVGGGVALLAAWKAVGELAGTGVAAGPGSKPPLLFAVQASGCAPVVQAFDAGREETEPFAAVATLAAGLRVPAPKAGFLILRALRATGGGAVAVTDEAILRTMSRLRREEGLNLCPEGAAAVAALPELAQRGWLDGCRDIVVVNTGSGLKYPELAGSDTPARGR